MPKRAFLGHQLTGKWTANDCIDVKFTQWIKYTTIMQENIPFLRKFALKSAVKFHDIRNLHLKTQNIKSHLCWLWAQGASPPEDPGDWLLQGHHHWPSTRLQSCFHSISPTAPWVGHYLHFTNEKTEALGESRVNKSTSQNWDSNPIQFCSKVYDLPTKLCDLSSDIMTGRQEIWEQCHLWRKHGHLWNGPQWAF